MFGARHSSGALPGAADADRSATQLQSLLLRSLTIYSVSMPRKAILSIKAESRYKDLPEERYHFSRRLLRRAQESIGEQVIYYETGRTGLTDLGRTGRESYIACGRIAGVIPDPDAEGYYFALIDGYLPFVRPVPFREAEHFYESFLKKPDGTTNRGAAGQAIRHVPDDEFELILAAGLGPALGDLRAEARSTADGFSDPPAEFERPIVQQLVNRKVRDALFSRFIRDTYDATCAVSGLRIVNGGGRAEIEAAHIRPVEQHGPDSPRNGIALCRTAHWMFDRGLLALTSDERFIVNTQRVPEDARRLLRQDGRLILPRDASVRPHPLFIDWHRIHVFEPKLVQSAQMS